MNVYQKNLVALSVLLIALFFGAAVFAADGGNKASAIQEVQEVQRLIEQKDFAQAEKQANAYLAQNPDVPEMRLLYGVALAKQGKNSPALLVFQALIKSHPDLPEAYNNLAALHAEGRQYSRAREVLEQGIATNPTYDQLHKNLSAIYAEVAKEAYKSALLLPPAKLKNGENTGSNLTLDQSLVVALSNQAESKTVPKGKPIQLPAAVIEVEPTPQKQVAVVAENKPKPDQVVPTPKVVKTSATETGSAEKAVEAAVKRWAKAWESQDLKAYFASYGDNFKPAKGRSRSAWEAFRRSRIEGKSSIQVRVQNLKVRVNGDKARARFTQRYRAGSFKATGRKTLNFELENGSWVIVSENIN